MTTSHKKLIEDVASASGVEPLIICKIINDEKYAVAMFPALFAHLDDLRMFVEYPLDRLRIPLVIINLLVVFHVHVNSNILLDGPPG